MRTIVSIFAHAARLAAIPLCVLCMPRDARAATEPGVPITWSGRGAPSDANWSALTNWNCHLPFDGLTVASAVVFDQYSAHDGARRMPELDADTRIASVRFHGGGFDLRSSSKKTLTLALAQTAADTGSILNIAGNNTISHRVAFADGVTNARAVFVDSGTLTFAAASAIDLNGAAANGSSSMLTYFVVNRGAALVTSGSMIANAIPNSGAGTRLVKDGAGTWFVKSAANDLASFGDIRLHGGAIDIAVSNPFGGKTITNTPGANNSDRQIYINTPGLADSTPINMTSGATTSTMTIGSLAASGTVTFAGSIKLSQPGTGAGHGRTRFMAAGGVTVVFKGVIGNNSTAADRKGAVEKTGAGTVVFEGASTYTEGTLVSEGVLLFNNTGGSGAGTGDVMVAQGAAAGGSGAISGALVSSGTGATVRPLAGVFTVGALDVSAGVTIAPPPDPAAARIDVTGALTGGAGKIVFDFGGASGAAPGTTWTLLTFASAQNINLSQLVARGVPGTFAIRAGAIEFLVAH